MNEVFEDLYTIREYTGFNYFNFLGYILDFIASPDFVSREYETPKFKKGGEDWDVVVNAYKLTENLSDVQVEELRNIMNDGFQNNWSIVKIKREIQSRVKPESLELENGAIIDGEIRSVLMARTETVRATNQGLLSMLGEQGVENVQWIASYGDRTCAYCDDMNGEILSLDEADEMIPAHSMCRCSWAVVTE